MGQLASDSAKWDGNSEHYLYRLADGGATGVVTPIHQLIARGVTKIIAFANYDNKFVSDKSKWSPKRKVGGDWILGESIDNGTPLYFGVPTVGIKYGSMDYSPEHNQIFHRHYWGEFVDCLQNNANSGKGTFCKMNLKTKGNSWWGIAEGIEVELAFFYLNSAPGFDALLPKETKDESDAKDSGLLKNFPQYHTLLNNAQGLAVGTVFSNTVGITDIGVHEANLLASQTKWVAKNFMGDLNAMFKSVPAPTNPPTRPLPSRRPEAPYSMSGTS